MAHGVGVITMVPEATVLSSSEPARRHCKRYHLRPTNFRYKIEKVFIRKCCLYPLRLSKSNILGGILPELLFIKFLQNNCINCLRVKEREKDRVRKRLGATSSK